MTDADLIFACAKAAVGDQIREAEPRAAGDPLRLPSAGQSQGTVTRRSRKNGGDSRGAEDWKSSALLTIRDVAAHTQVSYWTARGWIESGKLHVLRLPGRLVRIDPAELKRFLEACR